MRKHMVEIHEKDFYAGIDIVFDWRLGLDLADTSDFRDTSKVFTNTRGIYVEADIGDYVSFQTMSFLGVPSGFVVSQTISPSKPTTSLIVSANSLIVTSVPVPTFTKSFSL